MLNSEMYEREALFYEKGPNEVMTRYRDQVVLTSQGKESRRNLQHIKTLQHFRP